ncbi:hypothetical protein B0T17DRAFT_508754 [Bombardia bombarda]|uniref:Uncharacterized protein n=1 Tax=Bombardia bombarda TaxID=252184 RepID=A0AA39WTM9_9PEZI|nr:hypothetical protein B0T17DRAFT_508754 [Bombardia bombarda]
MNGGRTKARTRHSRTTPTKAVQKNLLAAAPHKGVGTEIPRVQSPVNGGLARDATLEQTAKRQLDATSESDALPAKRARLTRTGALRPGVEEAEQVEKPKPQPPKYRDTFLPEPNVEGQEHVPPVTRLRKRQIDSEGDDDEHELKRARLTRNNLALFNKMGRKKGSAPPDSAGDSSSIKTTSITSSGFAILARKNGILNPSSSKPPENLGAIRERYAQPRETASPTESAYGDYVDTVDRACNEATMVVEVSGQLLKKYPRGGYTRAFNQAFTAFPNDVGFNNGLSAPQPDFVEGPEMQDYLPFPVDEYVGGAVLYKENPRSVTLAHLAGEWKGPGKDMENARLQSAYDGAALVYARNQALSYVGKTDPPGHAEVTTFTTDGTTINTYAHYTTRSEDGTLEYHQYPVRSTTLVDSHQGLKDGRRGLRNEQDHARQQSYALKDQLKGHWKQRRGAHQPVAEGAHLDDIPEDPLPAQENKSYPDDDGEVEEPSPPAQSTRHSRPGRKAPPAHGTDDDSGYEIVDRPSYAPTPPRSSEERRRSTRLSNARQQSSDDPANTTAKKHKSSSRGKAETRADYWQWDARRRRYFHQHAGGAITWAEDGFSG